MAIIQYTDIEMTIDGSIQHTLNGIGVFTMCFVEKSIGGSVVSMNEVMYI